MTIVGYDAGNGVRVSATAEQTDAQAFASEQPVSNGDNGTGRRRRDRSIQFDDIFLGGEGKVANGLLWPRSRCRPSPPTAIQNATTPTARYRPGTASFGSSSNLVHGRSVVAGGGSSDPLSRDKWLALYLCRDGSVSLQFAVTDLKQIIKIARGTRIGSSWIPQQCQGFVAISDTR